MNIGFDAKRLFLDSGGVGNYGRNTLHHLSHYAKDINAYLFTPEIKNNQSFRYPKNVKLVTPPFYYQGILKNRWHSHDLIKQIQSNKIDIYHGLSNALPRNVERFKCKSVVTIHDLVFLRFPHFYQKNKIDLYKKQFAFSTAAADMIITVSKQTKNDLLEFFKVSPQKVKVLYQSCHPLFFEKRSPKEKEHVKQKYNLPKNFILNVGTIEERKNLLSILRTLHDKHIDIPLVIVGEHTGYKDLALSYVAEHRMEKRVIFLRDINHHELSCIYQLALITLYPSLYEGFGIPVIESLASGTPVITSKGTCLKEAGGPNSLYVNPGSTEDISSALHSLLFDSEERQKRSTLGLEYVQKFKGEIIANQMKRMYQTLM